MKITTSDQAKSSELASEYLKSWRLDSSKAIAYLQSRKQISSQQHMLHRLIKEDYGALQDISLADFGCGGGWSTFTCIKYWVK